MPTVDETLLGLKKPHPDNNPRGTDVPNMRDNLDLLDSLIRALQTEKLSGSETAALITAAIDTLKGDAPEALDTLVEIAAKLSDNDDAVAALVAQIAQKADAAAMAAALADKADKATTFTKNEVSAAINALEKTAFQNAFFGG